MGIENFIRDALYKPNDYISYHIGRELAELHPGKTIVEGRTCDFPSKTENFSFAYLKELFVASMVQWMSAGGSMDEVILAQAALLQSQMTSKSA